MSCRYSSPKPSSHHRRGEQWAIQIGPSNELSETLMCQMLAHVPCPCTRARALLVQEFLNLAHRQRLADEGKSRLAREALRKAADARGQRSPRSGILSGTAFAFGRFSSARKGWIKSLATDCRRFPRSTRAHARVPVAKLPASCPKGRAHGEKVAAANSILGAG